MALGIFVLLTALAAAIGAYFVPGEWYAGLAKPSWTPPNYVFAPVWAVLYVMIAAAGALAWQGGARGWPIALWGASLVFNAAWSWLFFGRHSISGALVDIALLWLAVAAFALAVWPWSRAASLLFLPYLAWVSVAAALNLTIWRMNG